MFQANRSNLLYTVAAGTDAIYTIRIPTVLPKAGSGTTLKSANINAAYPALVELLILLINSILWDRIKLYGTTTVNNL